MRQTIAALVVGLAPNLLGANTPNLMRLANRGGLRSLNTVTPAVTCSVQSTLLTGLAPDGHGAVGNGWYFRDLCEPMFWRQPNGLIAGEKIWEAGRARDPSFTCAKIFWWYNMYSSANWSATPRPMYFADGRKVSDHYTHPPELHDELDQKLGQFPLFKFWGPFADFASSKWIAGATQHLVETRSPTLTLTYVPHLDYNLQRLGPDVSHPRLQADLSAVDTLCGVLIDLANKKGMRILIVSEYGVTHASESIHINRCLREAGLLAVRTEQGHEQLDAGASEAFALADHQIAHVYVADPGRITGVKQLLQTLDGIEAVWDDTAKRSNGLDHPRSGELVALAKADRWFSYYFWQDDARAPDYARTVDIHRKPGYDPMELFVDPKYKFPAFSIGWRLAKRKLGFRQLLDIIPLNGTSLVKGTHGRITNDPADGPLVISSEPDLLPDGPVDAKDFKALTLDHVFS